MKSILVLAALSGFLHAQGVLTPPAGPAPMMKSLDQIEPRTPISSLPYTITESGSYYFTRNLHSPGGSGSAITINAGGYVKLDLMGFTLSSSEAVTGIGISITSQHAGSATVCNGSIEGKTTVTHNGDPVTWTVSTAGFRNGIYDRSQSASFENLSISGAAFSGLSSTGRAKVKNVCCRNNGWNGIVAAYGTVINCTAYENGGNGIVASFGCVTSSSSSENGEAGIYAPFGTVTSCSTRLNGGSGISAYRGSVTSSTAAENGSVGIYATEGSVTNSTASSNTGDDISASNAVVAYCRFTTFAMSNSSRTGNFPSP